MKMRAKFLAAAAVMLMIGSTGASAMGKMPPIQHDQPSASGSSEHHSGGRHGGRSVPEIDAAAGTSAIALMVGVLALMKERGRSRKSPKSEA